MHAENIPRTGAAGPVLTPGHPEAVLRADRHRLGALALVFCAVAMLTAIADRAPMHLEKRFPSATLRSDVTSYFEGVVQRTSPGPYVYRVLVPYGIAAVHSVMPALSPVDIDLGFKIVALVLCQFFFYVYLRLYFPPVLSLAGVLLLDVLVAFALSAIQGPSIIETSDIVNVCFYSLALAAMATDAFGTLCVVLLVSTLNRETTWLLLPVLFFADRAARKGLNRSLLATLCVAVPYFGVRLAVRTSVPDWFTVEGIGRNIPFLSSEHTAEALAGNLHVVILLGPLLILGLYRFREHPLFLRTATLMIPFFLAVHYAFGWIIEARLWMPLFIILIPLALGTLAPMLDETSGRAGPAV